MFTRIIMSRGTLEVNKRVNEIKTKLSLKNKEIKFLN